MTARGRRGRNGGTGENSGPKDDGRGGRLERDAAI